MVKQVRYPVKSDAIREIQEEISKSRISWDNIKMLRPIYISVKYYEFIKGTKVKKEDLN